MNFPSGGLTLRRIAVLGTPVGAAVVGVIIVALPQMAGTALLLPGAKVGLSILLLVSGS